MNFISKISWRRHILHDAALLHNQIERIADRFFIVKNMLDSNTTSKTSLSRFISYMLLVEIDNSSLIFHAKLIFIFILSIYIENRLKVFIKTCRLMIKIELDSQYWQLQF